MQNTYPISTDNTNNLFENKYQLLLDRCPKTIFMVTSVSTPDFTVSLESVNTMMGVPFFMPSTKGSYGNLVVTFLVDEDLANYKEILAWIKSNINETNFTSKLENRALTQNSGKPLLTDASYEVYNYSSDASLVTLTNSGNPNKIMKFYSAIPTNISGINFTNKSAGTLSATVIFTIESLEIS